MPSLTLALDLPVLHQLGHDPVEVIRLDLERLGDLRDGDTRAGAHQLQRLGGAGVTAAAPARAPRPTRRAACPGGTRRARWATRTTARAHQGGASGLEL